MATEGLVHEDWATACGTESPLRRRHRSPETSAGVAVAAQMIGPQRVDHVDEHSWADAVLAGVAPAVEAGPGARPARVDEMTSGRSSVSPRTPAARSALSAAKATRARCPVASPAGPSRSARRARPGRARRSRPPRRHRPPLPDATANPVGESLGRRRRHGSTPPIRRLLSRPELQKVADPAREGQIEARAVRRGGRAATSSRVASPKRKSSKITARCVRPLTRRDTSAGTAE